MSDTGQKIIGIVVGLLALVVIGVRYDRRRKRLATTSAYWATRPTAVQLIGMCVPRFCRHGACIERPAAAMAGMGARVSRAGHDCGDQLGRLDDSPLRVARPIVNSRANRRNACLKRGRSPESQTFRRGQRNIRGCPAPRGRIRTGCRRCRILDERCGLARELSQRLQRSKNSP